MLKTEDWFFDFFSEPNDAVKDPILRLWYDRILSITFNGPGMGESFELFTCRFVKVKSGIGMVVQKGWRNLIGDFSFDWSFNNARFALRPSHYDDFFCFFYRVDTHGDRSFGDIIYSLEGFGSVSSGESVEVHEPCTAVDWWWRLIESNMSSPSNTKNLNVNTTIRLDFLFIVLTKFCHLASLDFPVRNVHVFFGNVNVVEEVVPHVKIIRFWILVQNRVILIQIESYDVFEWKSFLFVQSDQLSVNQQWSAPCGHAQYELLPFLVLFLNCILYDSCDLDWSLLSCFEKAGLDFFNQWKPLEWRKVFVCLFYLYPWSNDYFFSFHTF